MRDAVAVFLVTAANGYCLAQGLPSFGTPPGKPPLPNFGRPLAEEALRRQFPKLAAAVTASDRENAAREIKRTDANGDGVVTESEWATSGYQAPDRFRVNDLNGDGSLTLFEHSLRWTQYRLGRQQASAPPNAQATKKQSTEANSPAPPVSRPESRGRQTADLATFTLSVYDRNRSGSIDRDELQSPHSAFGSVAPADANGDGAVSHAELTAWLSSRRSMQAATQLDDEIPAWFLTADLDRDGQVQLTEFLKAMPRQPIHQFERFDRNQDGLVTTRELAAPQGDGVQWYASGLSSVVEPDRVTFSELLINDDFAIQDIDVQLALVKNGDDDIELSLMAPDGTTATLYFENRNKPWGGGRLFENTIIDDEAPSIPQRLAQPPLHRTFQSQGSNTRGLLGLKAFYKKRARGTWRLTIRNRSKVAGLLEGWALLVTPSNLATNPANRPAAEQTQ
jgi:Ca2+-binding EF-hand superfamily protein